jgi:hypothetical protein
MVLTIADRFETVATSIAAAFMNIPLVHTQGGEVTGNIDEKVRHANTKLADLHFVTTERSRERVLRMGEKPDRVFVTGCPSIDLASEVLKEPAMGFDMLKKYGGVGDAPDFSRGYLGLAGKSRIRDRQERRRSPVPAPQRCAERVFGALPAPASGGHRSDIRSAETAGQRDPGGHAAHRARDGRQ